MYIVHFFGRKIHIHLNLPYHFSRAEFTAFGRNLQSPGRRRTPDRRNRHALLLVRHFRSRPPPGASIAGRRDETRFRILSPVSGTGPVSDGSTPPTWINVEEMNGSRKQISDARPDGRPKKETGVRSGAGENMLCPRRVESSEIRDKNYAPTKTDSARSEFAEEMKRTPRVTRSKTHAIRATRVQNLLFFRD